MRIAVSFLTSVKPTLLAAVASAALIVGGMDAALAAGQGQGAGPKGQGAGAGQGGPAAQGQMGKGGRSLEDIFRDVTGDDDGDESDAPAWAGQPGGKSGKGGGKPAVAGSKKGDLFGDLVVILRDEQGVPILSDAGFVQPIDAEGDLIPLDDEGAPIDETLLQAVELGRLNVGRAPTSVLLRRAEEVTTLLNDATAVTLDPAGRLTVTTLVDGVEMTKTIDSPLENLSIYVALLTQGAIPGVADLPGDDLDFMVDGEYTVEDLAAAAAFLAAATDKTSPFTSDEIAYIDAFLGINTTTVGDVTYSVIDYEPFSYDRSDTFENAVATVLVQQPDGSWVPDEVNIYEAVFDKTDYSASGTLDAFTQAAEDARLVVEYVHEYTVPVEQLTSN